MGHPKNFRRKYERPKKPYDKERIASEKKTKDDFGLRRKRELWRADAMVREFRRRARDLQAREDKEKEKVLLEKINKLGIKCEKLDEVLKLETDAILSRRLQTVIHKKGIANTPKQARQFIVHGHITIEERKVVWPGFIVEDGVEEKITLAPHVAAKIVAEQKQREEVAKTPAKEISKEEAAPVKEGPKQAVKTKEAPEEKKG